MTSLEYETSSTPFRIFSAQGGGILGIATATFLAGIEHHHGAKASDRFQLFCGTSTGAIIALGLAFGLRGSEITSLYRKLGAEVFSGGWHKTLKQFVRAKHDGARLRDALSSVFGTATLGDLLTAGRCVLVPAFCISTGRPRVFKTDHSPALSAHNGYRIVDVAMASCAAPTYLPIVEVSSPTTNAVEYFCDGGIFANDPSLLGYVEALAEFNVDPGRVSILSLSTPRTTISRPHRPRSLDKGKAHWAQLFPQLAIGGTSLAAHETLARLTSRLGSVFERIELSNDSADGPVAAIDEATESSLNALQNIGEAAAQLKDNRLRTQGFFRDT